MIFFSKQQVRFINILAFCSLLVICLSLRFTPHALAWGDNWESIKKGAEGIRSIQADFTQEKIMKILSKPLISKGAFYYQMPNALRWEYNTPVRSILLMHKGKIKRYIKHESDFVEDSSPNLQGMQIVLQEIIQWLKGRFDDNPDFNPTLEPGPKIVLTPKQKGLSRMILRIELFLSTEPGLIKSVIIYESEDSFTRLEFTNAKLNTEIKDTFFQKIE